MNARAIDLKSNIFGCDHIKWWEVLWLPQYRMYTHPPDDQVIANLISIGKRFDMVREILGNEPMSVTSGFRPEAYNKHIKGAKRSAHISGEAIDFQHSKLNAYECRARLLPHLNDLKIRMEDLPRSNWVHIDLRKPGSGRYFKP